jgi:2-dehydro-3-deoxyphosphogluconate aldolase/(4S)-4-hydroxy-2-oxoglutarate aldolase
MMMDKLIGTQSIIITLDVDAFLFDKLQQIVNAGFSVVEINCVEEALLQKVLNSFPSLRIGAGNIVTTQQLEICYQAGVHFVTSPGFLPAIAQTAAIYSINYIPGIATISEAMQAISVGCQHARPFPASLSFCTLLNKYLPLLRLFPAEVEWDEVEHFLNLPAVAAVSIINPELKQLCALKNVSELATPFDA